MVWAATVDVNRGHGHTYCQGAHGGRGDTKAANAHAGVGEERAVPPTESDGGRQRRNGHYGKRKGSR
jgi:hypothetical protein